MWEIGNPPPILLLWWNTLHYKLYQTMVATIIQWIVKSFTIDSQAKRKLLLVVKKHQSVINRQKQNYYIYYKYYSTSEHAIKLKIKILIEKRSEKSVKKQTNVVGVETPFKKKPSMLSYRTPHACFFFNWLSRCAGEIHKQTVPGELPPPPNLSFQGRAEAYNSPGT